MKHLVEYTHCLAGGGMLIIRGIPKVDGGILVLTIEFFAPVIQQAA